MNASGSIKVVRVVSTKEFETMYIVNATNVNTALTHGLTTLIQHGEKNDSRNGPVLSLPAPCITVYKKPMERVLFSNVRDANPFFHFFESLWMLCGRNDLDFMTHFVKRFSEYSDDGDVLHGAYGFRWREFFAFDQLTDLVTLLRRDPTTRRAVLAMWSPNGDLVSSEGMGGINNKDIPCNTHVYFDRRGDVLNMTVLCRSNDAIWGAYGANAVHFSMLQEYMAARVGCRVGTMYQFSNNLHVYAKVADEEKMRALRESERDLYTLERVKPSPLISISTVGWEEELAEFMDRTRDYQMITGSGIWTERFFANVAVPMWNAHVAYKQNDTEAMFNYASVIIASDWRVACIDWLTRRTEKKGAAK
jgi:thymidylate synthase